MTDADQEASPTTAEAVPAVPVTSARGLVRLRGADGFVQLRACAPKPQTSRQKGVAHANCGEEESEKGTMNKTSIAWVRGGPGGVQAEINLWRDLWKEAIEMVRQ